MRHSKQILTLVLLTLFTLSAQAYQRYDSNYNRGLSLNIGYASESLRLNYSNSHYPKKYFSKNYRYNLSTSNRHEKAYPNLGYKKPAIPHHKTYSNKHPALGGQFKKHSAYKPFYNVRDRHYNDHHRYTTKACHPVTKLITDIYGYYHSVSTTMCYDRFGRGYIVDRR